jgi:predicted metal-dependent hydrolase
LSRVKVDGNQFIIYGHGLNQVKSEEIVKDYLLAKAKTYMVERTIKTAKYLGLDRKILDIKFRKTKTKWGHCTSQGVLQFNWLIMLAPLGVIDYMIAHEVCHLRYMNHSRKFWQMVESICPKSSEYALWLKQNEHRLWF